MNFFPNLFHQISESFLGPALAVSYFLITILGLTWFYGRFFSRGRSGLMFIKRHLVALLILMTLIASVTYPIIRRSQLRSQHSALLNDITMIASAAESYTIENGMAPGLTVDFDSLIEAQYFKRGSRISKGLSYYDASAVGTLGEFYSAIDPMGQITIDHRIRALFTPFVSTNDSFWDIHFKATKRKR